MQFAILKGRSVGKAKSPEDIILDALKKAFQALPASLPLCGSKSLFTESNRSYAEKAVRDGYLTKKEVLSGKGARAKNVPHGVLTEVGSRKVIENESPKAALDALLPAVKILASSTSPNPQNFQAVLDTATEKCVNVIRSAFTELRREVLKAISPATGSADPAPVLAALEAALKRVDPAQSSAPGRVEPPPVPSAAVNHTEKLMNEIVAYVGSLKQRGQPRCDFEELFNHLTQLQPPFTIGMFQDALRALHKDNPPRIRLGDLGGDRTAISRRDLAFFVANTEVYYVRPVE